MNNRRRRQQSTPAPAPAPWADPTFHFGASAGSGLTGGLGALPWWAVNPGDLSPSGAGSGDTSTSTPSPTFAVTPESRRSPGYMGQADPAYTTGGSPTGDLGPGYELNSRQAARLGGTVTSLFGGPGDAVSRLINTYAQRTGNNNPFGPSSGGSYTPGVTVTDNDANNAQPQFRYQGVGSDPLGGGFGDNYYGPSRGGTLADYGDAAMNNFTQSQADYWNMRHPGQGVGGMGMGGFGTGWQGGTAGGGVGVIYSGSASPWDWGGGMSY